MDLYPLTFQEFLCALGEERFVNILQGTDTDMVTTFKSKYIDRLREYYYVGGMPEVVQTYVETKDFNQVRQIQKNLLNYYQQDFSKHAKTSLVPRLNLVWNSIPMQLAKKNKKYIYFKKLVSTVDPDILKAYMETILDSIYTADGKITAITFKNGLTHRFIYKDK